MGMDWRDRARERQEWPYRESRDGPRHEALHIGMTKTSEERRRQRTAIAAPTIDFR